MMHDKILKKKINDLNESFDRVENLFKEIEEIDKRIEQKMKYIKVATHR
jgi:prefoldin subunit 5